MSPTSPMLSALARFGTMTMTWEEDGVFPTRKDTLDVDMLSALAPSPAMDVSSDPSCLSCL